MVTWRCQSTMHYSCVCDDADGNKPTALHHTKAQCIQICAVHIMIISVTDLHIYHILLSKCGPADKTKVFSKTQHASLWQLHPPIPWACYISRWHQIVAETRTYLGLTGWIVYSNYQALNQWETLSERTKIAFLRKIPEVMLGRAHMYTCRHEYKHIKSKPRWVD